jgi:crotonobetainyl-CoA:carnitine CoA-transferase CaiB-like acyl-CoA transferase
MPGALWAEINPILTQRRSADLVALFTASRIPHAVVNTLENVHEDAQVVSQNALEISVHPDAGRVRVARPPRGLQRQRRWFRRRRRRGLVSILMRCWLRWA